MTLLGLQEQMVTTLRERKLAQDRYEQATDALAMVEVEYGLAEAKATLKYKDVVPADVRKAQVVIETQSLSERVTMKKAEKMGLSSRLEVLGKELDALRSFYSLAKEEARMSSWS